MYLLVFAFSTLALFICALKENRPPGESRLASAERG